MLKDELETAVMVMETWANALGVELTFKSMSVCLVVVVPELGQVDLLVPPTCTAAVPAAPGSVLDGTVMGSVLSRRLPSGSKRVGWLRKRFCGLEIRKDPRQLS